MCAIVRSYDLFEPRLRYNTDYYLHRHVRSLAMQRAVRRLRIGPRQRTATSPDTSTRDERKGHTRRTHDRQWWYRGRRRRGAKNREENERGRSWRDIFVATSSEALSVDSRARYAAGLRKVLDMQYVRQYRGITVRPCSPSNLNFCPTTALPI